MIIFSNKNYGISLFNNKFKLVGIITIAIATIVAFINKFYEPIIVVFNPSVTKQLTVHLIVIGMFLYCFSKEKKETDALQEVKLKAFVDAFVFVTILYLINPFVNIILREYHIYWSAPRLILYILFFYQANYLSTLFFLRKNNDEEQSNNE